MRDDILQRTYDARDAYFRTLGDVDDLVLAPLINPTFMGGPRWPALRQAWRVIRNGDRTLLVSDGLSDPFDPEEADDIPDENPGFGIEMLIETTDKLEGSLQNDWPFEVIYAVSQQAAHHGGFRDLIDEFGVLSMEIRGTTQTIDWHTDHGTTGLLLGLQPPDFPTEFTLPGGPIRVITVKVLHPTELAYAVEHDAEGRQHLQHLFAEDGSHHRSSLQRVSRI